MQMERDYGRQRLGFLVDLIRGNNIYIKKSKIKNRKKKKKKKRKKKRKKTVQISPFRRSNIGSYTAWIFSIFWGYQLFNVYDFIPIALAR